MTTRAGEDGANAGGNETASAIDLKALAEKISKTQESLDRSDTVKAERRTGYAPTVTPDSIEPIDSEPAPKDETFGERYSGRDLLGEGGMGEVRLTHDARIGRDVAMKVVRKGAGSRSDMRSRFLREARVQGQLEHPAVVPVYDLGTRPDGAAFFTMKRVRGNTLEEILDDLRAREPAALAEYSRRKLLSAFVSVCLAIEFAHARGVVHRDLKPGNIMLGGFGEVYVLDWGLAKIKTDGAPISSDTEQVDAPLSIRGQTEAGAVMGTPGYMAPEQLVTNEVDGRADIYALGAILFEIVTLKPLHDRPKLAQVLDSTLTGPETRASMRVPGAEIPPELEAIWTRATALQKEKRQASAREISDAIESFLDGDRDMEQRRKAAEMHTSRGEDAVKRALESRSSDERKAAMQELGRALALDPSNVRAVRLMAELVATPPPDLPLEAEEELRRAGDRSLRVSGRAAFYAYTSWFLFFPFTIIAGYREAWLSMLMGVCMLVAVLCSLTLSRQERPDERYRLVAVAASMLAIGLSSRIFGPFMLVPALVLANTVGFSLTRGRTERRVVTALGCGTFAIPFALEWLGIISPSYVFTNGHIEIMPHILLFAHPQAALALLLSTHVGIMIAAVAYVGVVRDNMKRYERHALVQAWHFRQLAPDEARVAAPDPQLADADLCKVRSAVGSKAASSP